MKVKELVTILNQVDQEARIFCGYDGNIVVTEPGEVAVVEYENEIRPCWHSVKVGDVVIFEA
jgi:hypothetical protein